MQVRQQVTVKNHSKCLSNAPPRVNELLLKLNPDNLLKVAFADVFIRVNLYEKMEIEDLDITIQDMSIPDNGADIHGV